MNEHSYIRSVHKKLPPSLYRWKINDNFEGGVADAFYSGNIRQLWIEYKYIRDLPKRPSTLIVPDCSALQKRWLRSRYNEGNNVLVIVGSPQGAVLFADLSWEQGITAEVFKAYALTPKEVAELIYAHCSMEECHVKKAKVYDHSGRSSERKTA